MNYNEYEDYMRSVLGYNSGNIYTDPYRMNSDFYYNTMPNTQTEFKTIDTESLNEFYPEIYKLLYPMVCKICNQNANREITKDLIDSMTEEIYINFEADEKRDTSSNMRNLPPLKNGDVRNPNAKEPEYRGETRQNNFLLRDLIRILILKEFGKPNRPGFPGGRPPIVPPPPPRPSRPPMGPSGPGPWRPY